MFKRPLTQKLRWSLAAQLFLMALVAVLCVIGVFIANNLRAVLEGSIAYLVALVFMGWFVLPIVVAGWLMQKLSRDSAINTALLLTVACAIAIFFAFGTPFVTLPVSTILGLWLGVAIVHHSELR